MLPGRQNAYDPCRTSCRSMLHRIRRPRKPIFRRQICISTSYRRIVVTTSGFVVSMPPGRQDSYDLYRTSCRSIFHRLRRPRKPIFRRQHCNSISLRRIAVTTSVSWFPCFQAGRIHTTFTYLHVGLYSIDFGVLENLYFDVKFAFLSRTDE